LRFKRAFGVAVGRDGSGRFWFAERYAPMVLTLVAFAVVAFAPQLGDASPRHPHRANGWARTLYKPKLAHVSLPKLGPGNRIASKGPARPAKAPKGKPLPLLTTATSRAYATKNGMTETRIFAAPVNYKGTDEKWHPIQNRLVSAGKGALRNKANRYKLTLPRTANRPVRMRIGRSWLSFKLVGAHGKASVRRNIATYKNALDNVSLSYAAEGAWSRRASS
jgi:hypothetical protein